MLIPAVEPGFVNELCDDVEVEARGDHFVMRINDQFVDSFHDFRLGSGGVGFFAGHGESSRVCWVCLTSNIDRVGKVCELLTPNSGS